MFSTRQVFFFTLVFCTAVLGANLALRGLLHLGLAFHFVPSWPINVFERAEVTRRYRLAVGVLLFCCFFFANRFLARRDYRFPLTLFVGFTLIIGSNLLQGWEHGFVDPITADEFRDEPAPQYYHDAINITDPVVFFRDYNELQPTLQMHARNHPPGAVLLIYTLLKLLKEPALISIALAALACALAGYFFYQLLRTELPASAAGFMTFLFLLLPSVQIYYLVTIDALVAALLLGVFLFFQRGGAVHLIASGALLAAALMLNLISIWIVPVLFGFDLIRRRNILRAAAVITGVAVVYVAVAFFFSFNLVRCFETASDRGKSAGFQVAA